MTDRRAGSVMDAPTGAGLSVIAFVKMEGIGNDYIYVDAVRDPVFAQRDDLPALARAMADRHFGIGADGLIVIAPPRPGVGADGGVRMIMFNADGSEGAMCGNGIRCVAKYAVDRSLVRSDSDEIPIETRSGVRIVTVFRGAHGLVQRVRVDMGEPSLDPEKIGIRRGELAQDGPGGGLSTIQLPDGTRYQGTIVSMGNPHFVIGCDDVEAIDLPRIGPMIETYRAFADRINVHFVQVDSPTHLTMRTWERGSGITLACGTGAAAVGVSGVLRGWCDRLVTIALPGGELEILWDKKSNHVFMTGPAREVFSGKWVIPSTAGPPDE